MRYIFEPRPSDKKYKDGYFNPILFFVICAAAIITLFVLRWFYGD